MQELVMIIPVAWQFPDIAEALIKVRDKAYKSPGYKKSKFSLSKEISVANKVIGHIEVCYPVRKIPFAEDIFLKEESDLLDGISGRTGDFIEITEKSGALMKSEQNLRNIIENINDVIYEYDKNGIITFISPVVEKLFGFRPEEVTGKSVIQFVGKETKYLQHVIKELKEKGEIHSEYQIKSKYGELHWANLSTKAVFDGEILIGGAGILTDITQRKLAEIEREKVIAELNESRESYRNLVENINDAIYEVSDLGIVEYVSPAIEKIIGYKPEELIGKGFFFIHAS